MPSDKHCCVPGCMAFQEGSKTVLHGFPNPYKDKQRFNTWLYAIGGDILAIETDCIYKYRRVCHSHFEKKFHTYKDRISRNAVPTLNMPDTVKKMESWPIEMRKPIKNISNRSAPSTSHSEEAAEDVPQEITAEAPSGADLDPPPTQPPTAKPAIIDLKQNKPATRVLVIDNGTICTLQRDNALIGSQTDEKAVIGSQAEDVSDDGDIQEREMVQLEDMFDFNLADDDFSEHDIGELYSSVLDHDHDDVDRAPSTASQFIRDFTVVDDDDVVETYQSAVSLQDYCRSCLSSNTIEVPESLSLAFTVATGVSMSDMRYPRRLCPRCAAYVRMFVRFKQATRHADVMLKKLVDTGVVNRSSITSVKQDCSKYLPEHRIKRNLTNHFDAEYSHDEDIDMQFNNTKNNDDEKRSFSASETLQTLYDDDYFDSNDMFVSENISIHTDVAEEQNIDPNIMNMPVKDLQKQGVPIRTITKLVKLKPVTDTGVISELSQKANLNIVPYGQGLKLCNVQTVKRPLQQYGVRKRKIQNNNIRRRLTPAEREKREILFNEFFETEVLSFQQQMENLLKKKETPDYINSTFKCELCFRGFSYKHNIARHRNAHSGKAGPLSCPVCHVRFSCKSRYLCHKGEHRIKLRCKKCGYAARSRHIAMQHIDWHNGVKHTCDKCGQIFPYKSELSTHTRLRHPSDSVCGLCGVSFLTRRKLFRHISCKHKSEQDTIPPDGPRCSQCDIRFVNDEALLTHLQVSPRHREFESNDDGTRLAKRQPTKITCEQCGETVTSISKYVRHFKAQHPDCARTQYLTSVLCHLCGKTYQTPYFLKLHMNVHTQAHQYTCDHCGKTHTNRLRFLEHMKKHSGIQHPCLLCPKVFKTHSNLHRHKTEFHSVVRKHKCEYCEKSFKTREKVKRHTEFVHLEKPRPKRKRTQRKPSAAEPSPKRSRRDRQSLAAAIAACTQYVLQRTGRAIEGDDHVIESEKQVIESEDHVIESEDHVIESEDHVIESEDHVIESEDHVIESEDHVIESEEYVLESGDYVLESGGYVLETEDHDIETDVLEGDDDVEMHSNAFLEEGDSMMHSPYHVP